MTAPIPRLFVLRRDRDVTGVSGPGDVADGVQWPDGSVVLRWRERPSTSVWDSLDLMLSVHGHDGATRVVWADETEGEHDDLQQRIHEAVAAAWETGAVTHGSAPQVRRDIAKAVMAITGEVLAQRDRAQRAAGRAYQLADRWESAHGASMFLVRAAGAELRDELDGTEAGGIRGLLEHVGIDTRGRDITVDGHVVDAAAAPLPAAECSAQYNGSFEFGVRHCIRAAQHCGDHIDETGFHWSDTVAVYPLTDSTLRESSTAAVRCGHRGPHPGFTCAEVDQGKPYWNVRWDQEMAGSAAEGTD
jgi:hypothetical protein